MLVIENELIKKARWKKFAGVHFTYSYWQISLAVDSRVCQSFITPDGIFTLIRVLRGTTSAVLHLQPFLSNKLSHELLERVLLLVDDCIFHEETTNVLARSLQLFFEFCDE